MSGEPKRRKSDFLKKLIKVCPFTIDELQTDNGSEFALRFREACTLLSITHFHYPRNQDSTFKMSS